MVLNKAHNEAQEQELYAKEKIAAMENFEQKHRKEWLNELYNRITEIKQS